MHDALALCARLFPQGHDARIDGDLLYGTGQLDGSQVAIIGTVEHAAIGVDLALALASRVLETVSSSPGRPILMLVDTQGQRLSRRDELLGNAGYLAHLSKCFELARQRGHQLVSLVYGEAVSGGYLALGMIADRCFALADAQIRVMALPAMSRITQIPLERLQELCSSSAIFGPGVDNYLRLGALDAVWSIEDALNERLADALGISKTGSTPAIEDTRAQRGAELGGRSQAHQVAVAMNSELT
jgi:malonate decarboxylase gamma subunit